MSALFWRHADMTGYRQTGKLDKEIRGGREREREREREGGGETVNSKQNIEREIVAEREKC